MNRLKTDWQKKICLTTAAMCVIFSTGQALAFAEGDTVMVNQQSQYQVDKPRSGLSMQQVEAKFGSPSNRAPAVGEPPITRWVYGDFTVYFEHDRVIHSVAHRS